MKNIIQIHQPRCSWCKKIKADSELNNYDPLAPASKDKYKAAHCARIAQCDSEEARNIISEMTIF